MAIDDASNVYIPGTLSYETASDLQNDVTRELYAVAEAIRRTSEKGIPQKQYTEVSRPFFGQMVYAPAGANEWNPGSGTGLYIYLDRWHKFNLTVVP